MVSLSVGSRPLSVFLILVGCVAMWFVSVLPKDFVVPLLNGFPIRVHGKVSMLYVTSNNSDADVASEYHTGTLYLGYFNGPTEGVLIACAIHIISAVFGTKQTILRPSHRL